MDFKKLKYLLKMCGSKQAKIEMMETDRQRYEEELIQKQELELTASSEALINTSSS